MTFDGAIGAVSRGDVPEEVMVVADVFPVFSGLEEGRVSGREIAAMIGVTPPTISKWRRGRSRMPAAKLVFLTMLLANWLDEVKSLRRLEGGAVPGWLSEAEACLKQQEDLNAQLPPAVIHDGARLFQEWWQGTGGSVLAARVVGDAVWGRLA